MTASDLVRYHHDGECPRCNSPAYRVPRRFVDVLMSVFVAVRRYRCTAMGCSWEGNLRVSTLRRKAIGGSTALH